MPYCCTSVMPVVYTFSELGFTTEGNCPAESASGFA